MPVVDPLFEALSQTGIDTKTRKSLDAETVFAWLPSLPDGPLPSTPLVSDRPLNGVPPSLKPWLVSAFPLPSETAVLLLSSATGRRTLATGVVVGSTLAYWSQVLRFASALVARQQFLPGIRLDDDGFLACWEPVIAGVDSHTFSRLAKTMPHACRALSEDVSQAPRSPSSEVLQETLDRLVDHLVRSAGTGPDTASGRRRTRSKSSKSFDSVHDYWLHALHAPDGRMTGDPDELTRLAEQIRHWRRPITVAASAPFRLCLRLEEPEGPHLDDSPISAPDDWYVRYLLQAADDPSLLLPASEAWQPRGMRAQVFKKADFQPKEYLLSALGQAASLSGGVETSLQESEPGGFSLDPNGAHTFLNETSWLLEQAGFGVLLPSWWSRKGTKLHLGAKAFVKSPKLKGESSFSIESLLNFEWKVALGDQTLSKKELEALAKLKAPLVRVRGQWVQLSAEEIQAALAFWKTKNGGKLSAREAVHMALGLAEPPGGLAFEGLEASGWIEDLISRLRTSAGFEPLPKPEGFQGTLRPYQERGYSWLGFLKRWGFGACLADDMGLGKTIQTLAMIEHDWESAPVKKRRPTLLICPMSVVGNWQREAAKFTPDLPVLVHHGLGRSKGAAFKKQAKASALVISSYALLHRDFDTLKTVPWSSIVLDEAQNIKNPETKQAKAARNLPSEARIALTGTPVENHVGDLWSIMQFLNPGLLGSQLEFRRSFQVPIQAHRDPDAARRLQQITGPFILRRVKTDKSIIADLPDKIEMKEFCSLTKEQVSLYEAVVQDTARQLTSAEGIQRKGIILAILSKLKQVCNHPAHFLGDNSPIPGRSAKLQRLVEMLEEVEESGEKSLIFTQFSEMGAILQRHLQNTFGREVLFLHGGVPKAQRDLLVERFQSSADDAPRTFVLTVKAGGTGLNLTAASHVFHFDRWWNPAVENQATDRAYRIGQNRTVQVHKFVCSGTLEEKIDAMIEKKQQIAGSVIGSGEDWLTKLSTDELKDLFALREDALAVS